MFTICGRGLENPLLAAVGDNTNGVKALSFGEGWGEVFVTMKFN